MVCCLFKGSKLQNGVVNLYENKLGDTKIIGLVVILVDQDLVTSIARYSIIR
jgi:hypothetical protein